MNVNKANGLSQILTRFTVNTVQVNPNEEKNERKAEQPKRPAHSIKVSHTTRKTIGKFSPKYVQVKDLTYRHIATMFCRALPIEGEQFAEQVECTLETIKQLPQSAKVALKSAYIFSRKVPSCEREDFYQDIVLAVLKAKTNDEKLAYAIARCDWKDFWNKYKIRQHMSLDDVMENENDDGKTLGEMISGELEFERKIDSEMDALSLWNKLPDNIKAIVTQRLIGQALKHDERNTLNYWVKSKGYQLLMA
jgi:hypothetical protein